jgi:glycolate oxidase iron-sulfur subunit
MMASVAAPAATAAASGQKPERQPVRDIVDYELLFDCVHCGLCLESCPTYVTSRREMDSPRGRIYLMKAIAEGQIELDATAVRHFDLCLGCRGCETACPSGVRYGELIERTADYVERHFLRPAGERFKRRLLGALLSSSRASRLATAPVRALKALGLAGIARRFAPPTLRRMLELTLVGNPVPSSPWSSRPPHPARPTATVHRGCIARAIADSENSNIENVLRAAGYPVVELKGARCCGALDLHAGNRDRGVRLAGETVRAFTDSGADVILSAASGCAAAMAGYGGLLRNSPERAQAERLAAGVRDLSTLVVESGESVAPRFDCVVTYHDSCHLVHGLKVREAPRRLLRSIPGVRLIEMAESDLCCGSAGTYNLTEPEMAATLARRKVDNIIATEADYVVLANPGCEFQIGVELARRGARTRAIHIADFIALANRASMGSKG